MLNENKETRWGQRDKDEAAEQKGLMSQQKDLGLHSEKGTHKSLSREVTSSDVFNRITWLLPWVQNERQQNNKASYQTTAPIPIT